MLPEHQLKGLEKVVVVDVSNSYGISRGLSSLARIFLAWTTGVSRSAAALSRASSAHPSALCYPLETKRGPPHLNPSRVWGRACTLSMLLAARHSRVILAYQLIL
jgi:hypothetical protein